MRFVPNSIIDALETGAAKLCTVWQIERRDGQVLGFSDHDQPFVFQATICVPSSGLNQGALHSQVGISQPMETSIAGMISSDMITAEDIIAGLYDEARLMIYRVNWLVPDDFVQLYSGLIRGLQARGGIDDSSGAFIAHIDGLSQALERTIGRRFSHLCDANLGDSRCGIDINAAPQNICDKRFHTCHNIFANRARFRGFPDLPGEDFLTVYPRSGDVMTGGSRQQGAGR